jgi:hypothetical protein
MNDVEQGDKQDSKSTGNPTSLLRTELAVAVRSSAGSLARGKAITSDSYCVQSEAVHELYNVMAVWASFYGSECWALTKQQIDSKEIAEMRFLRAVARHSLTDGKLH